MLQPIDLSTRLAKLQATAFALIGISNFLCFIATVTPNWQVADDLDVGRTVHSGLWMYCQTGQACWYIFSDSLINYYEKADICRFLLIGDCRKKLVRTPYFFGWHYAVLVMMIIVMCLLCVCLVAIGVAHVMSRYQKIATIVVDAVLGFAFILLGVALAVFMANAEMLESRYLIGVERIFPKEYGYSFYLACLGLTVMLFAILSAVMLTTNSLFGRQAEGPIAYSPQGDYVFDSRGNLQPDYRIMKQQTTFPNYPPSEASTLQTRTFLSY